MAFSFIVFMDVFVVTRKRLTIGVRTIAIIREVNKYAVEDSNPMGGEKTVFLISVFAERLKRKCFTSDTRKRRTCYDETQTYFGMLDKHVFCLCRSLRLCRNEFEP